MPKVLWVALGCAMFFPCPPRVLAQSGDPALAELQVLAAQAPVVFAGEVVAIVRPASEATGVVEIRFRVDVALRGCGSAGIYTLREWAGLWSGNAPRYRVGQRLLMLLAAPAAGGLSTPVGGMDGAVPLVANGTSSPGLAATAALSDRLGLDLRWIAARSQRSGAMQPLAHSASSASYSLTNLIPLLSGSSYAAR